MKWNEFYQALKDGSLSSVYLFTGPEEYVKREALEALRGKLLPPGLEALNDTTLEGATAQQITDAAETLPMMCERRVVVVRDWAPLMPGKSKNEEAETEWMSKWLEHPPESCALVFYMRGEPDGRKKMTTTLKKKAEVVSFDLLTDAELSRWCASRLKPRGKKLSASALNTLTYMAGRELTRLSGELDKLAAYVGEDRTEITEADIREIVSASLEYNVFELLNSLLAGDLKKGQQIRQLTHMKCALDAGKPVQVVQEQLKLHPYAAKQTARQCARLSARWLTGLYEQCVEFDFAVKNGRLRDRDALDALILQIALADRRN